MDRIKPGRFIEELLLEYRVRTGGLSGIQILTLIRRNQWDFVYSMFADGLLQPVDYKETNLVFTHF